MKKNRILNIKKRLKPLFGDNLNIHFVYDLTKVKFYDNERYIVGGQSSGTSLDRWFLLNTKDIDPNYNYDWDKCESYVRKEFVSLWLNSHIGSQRYSYEDWKRNAYYPSVKADCYYYHYSNDILGENTYKDSYSVEISGYCSKNLHLNNNHCLVVIMSTFAENGKDRIYSTEVYIQNKRR